MIAPQSVSSKALSLENEACTLGQRLHTLVLIHKALKAMWLHKMALAALMAAPMVCSAISASRRFEEKDHKSDELESYFDVMQLSMSLSSTPSAAPSRMPSSVPTAKPAAKPSANPSSKPSTKPSIQRK